MNVNDSILTRDDEVGKHPWRASGWFAHFLINERGAGHLNKSEHKS